MNLSDKAWEAINNWKSKNNWERETCCKVHKHGEGYLAGYIEKALQEVQDEAYEDAAKTAEESYIEVVYHDESKYRNPVSPTCIARVIRSKIKVK